MIREAIYPPLAFGDAGKIGERDITEQTLAFAKTRVGSLRRSFKIMVDRITGDWDEISEAFGI